MVHRFRSFGQNNILKTNFTQIVHAIVFMFPHFRNDFNYSYKYKFYNHRFSFQFVIDSIAPNIGDVIPNLEWNKEWMFFLLSKLIWALRILNIKFTWLNCLIFWKPYLLVFKNLPKKLSPLIVAFNSVYLKKKHTKGLDEDFLFDGR